MLEIQNLHVSYDKNLAVAGFSMNAQASKITTVIGSNGAGKTTLLKSIAGLLPIQSGKIIALGEDVGGLSTTEIVQRGICLVPEGRELFPRMSVEENLLVGGYLRADRRVLRHDLNRIYGYFPVLGRKGNVPARSLSGGEQQMLAFGRALMAAPKILLLDEPSIGLAPQVEQQLILTLRELADETGVAIVLVEQNAALALTVSDVGYVLELGSKMLEGPSKELLSDARVKKAYLGI